MLAANFFTLNVRAGAALAMCAIVVLPVITACDNSDPSKTVGQKLDSAVAKTEKAAINVKDATNATVANASAALRDGADQAKNAAVKASDSVALSSQDSSITASVAAGLIRDPELSALKIDVDTKKGVVSLYGPAPSEAARMRATDIAKAVKGVSGVENKLTVKPN